MKNTLNKKGFTLIELLAVIVVLAIVTVLATRSILPYMSNARIDAFKIEATNVIKSAESAATVLGIGEINLKDNSASCGSGSVICFTIEELINLGLYDGSKDVYKGKVIVDTSESKPKYTLWLQKGAEFNIVAGTETDYIANGSDVKNGGFTGDDISSYSACSCS